MIINNKFTRGKITLVLSY